MTSKVSSNQNPKFLVSGLYLVTDSNLCLYHSLTTVIEEAVAGGVSIVQLREKSSNTRDFLNLAIEVKGILKEKKIPLIINDRVDVAMAIGADGVHLGQSDMPVDIARRLLGENAIIGLSLETETQLEKIPKLGNIDYLGISPIFTTPTKTDTKEPWGINGLIKIRKKTNLPLVAIGGINLTNAKQVSQAGANALAVVSYLCSAKDPKQNAKELLNTIHSHS